ncbi:hypothetical protein [Dyella monticola]|nr:hypothetical protein [Dyella monticola]
MNKVVVAALAATLLAGCATTAHTFNPATVATFQPGITTVAQAEAALGAPFQSTRMPDGSQQLQYTSKHEELAGDGTPTTGSKIPKRIETMVSTMLVFDASGHFVKTWSNSKTKSTTWPSDLGHIDSGEIGRNNGGG